MNKKNEYKDQCDNCPHNIQTHGACDLQDYYHCVSVCKTWADVYKHCPLKKTNRTKNTEQPRKGLMWWQRLQAR